jgi:hypothetical protein
MMIMAALLVSVLGLCVLECSCTGYKDLTDFYHTFNSVKSIDELKKLNLCEQKWMKTESTFGRRSGFADERPHLNGLRGTDVLVVHVGKTGGGTIAQMLKEQKIIITEVHAHAVDEKMIKDHSLILLCLRNPVERMVSAFNWRIPEDRLHKLKKTNSWTKCGSGSWKGFYGCCKDIDEYASKLREVSRCGTAARIGECHVELDTCSYVGGVVSSLKLNKKKVFVIDNKSIESDLNKISNKLGWNKTFTAPLVRVNQKSEKEHNATNTTEVLVRLREYTEITGENQLYNLLKRNFHLL